VTAMTINYGVLLGFVPSDDTEVGKYTEAVFLQALGYCIFFCVGSDILILTIWCIYTRLHCLLKPPHVENVVFLQIRSYAFTLSQFHTLIICCIKQSDNGAIHKCTIGKPLFSFPGCTPVWSI
jgi:hypothetical protein